MPNYRIAVLITCHNRKNQTLTCLTKLSAQEGLKGILVDVYLVDDGSTDGTVEAVRSTHPHVKIIQGNGDLFWCGGMRSAFSEAFKADYDYYLWLNDDTRLYPDALKNLLLTEMTLHDKLGQDAILVGSVCDVDEKRRTYGGSLIRKSRWRTITFKPVDPGKTPKPCDVFNGNCVLVPRMVAKAVGNLRTGFMQGGGDRDYGIRAAYLGYSSWICPGYIGVCRNNALLEAWKKHGLKLKERIQIVNHPARVHRIHDWMLFTRHHCKGIWPLIWLRSYLRLWFPWLWILFRLRTTSHHRP